MLSLIGKSYEMFEVLKFYHVNFCKVSFCNFQCYSNSNKF